MWRGATICRATFSSVFMVLTFEIWCALIR